MSKSKESKITNFLKEYDQKKQLYKEFSKEVKKILEELFQKNNLDCQPITCRVKEKESLENKLRKNIKKFNSVEGINDLAGCRAIFYLDKNVKKAGQCILQENFEIITSDSGLKYSSDGYNAYHPCY